MAMPEKMAPATKYGGKIVACQPGMTDVAKSQLTMVWTESTSGRRQPGEQQVHDLVVHARSGTSRSSRG